MLEKVCGIEREGIGFGHVLYTFRVEICSLYCNLRIVNQQRLLQRKRDWSFVHSRDTLPVKDRVENMR